MINANLNGKIVNGIYIPQKLKLPDSYDLIAVVGPCGAGKTVLTYNCPRTIDLDSNLHLKNIHEEFRQRYSDKWWQNPEAVKAWNAEWPNKVLLDYRPGTILVTADVPIIYSKRISKLILLIPSAAEMLSHHKGLDRYISHFTKEEHAEHNQLYADILNYAPANLKAEIATSIEDILIILHSLR